MKKLLIILPILVAVCLFSGCIKSPTSSSNEPKSLVGAWGAYSENGTILTERTFDSATEETAEYTRGIATKLVFELRDGRKICIKENVGSYKAYKNGWLEINFPIIKIETDTTYEIRGRQLIIGDSAWDWLPPT